MRMKPIHAFYYLRAAVVEGAEIELMLVDPRPPYKNRSTVRDQLTGEVFDCFHILDEVYTVGRKQGLSFIQVGSREELVLPASDLFEMKFIRHPHRLRETALRHLLETGVVKPLDQKVRMWVEMWPHLGNIDLDGLRQRRGKGGLYLVTA